MKIDKNYTIGLGIESTAHTFSASVVDSTPKVLSDVRRIYNPPLGSGIHPREASHHHSVVAADVVDEALRRAGCKIQDMDFVAFSAGPGLGPCLRVGAVVARTLASYYDLPLVAVNHAIGHIELGAMLTGASQPVVLLVSGGHTLIATFSSRRWRIFGETLDLTVGQLIDQLGREVGLSSPSGRKLEELASKSSTYIELPYTVKGNDVSFSGMLTAAKKLLRSKKKVEDIAYSLQETAFGMLAEVCERAVAFSEANEFLLTGGVAANKRLQEMLKHVCERQGAKFYVIDSAFSGDCGAQIAWAGLLGFLSNQTIDVEKSGIRQAWRIDQGDVPWRG